MPSSLSPSGAVVEVLGGLALAAGAGEEGVFMFKAFVVLRKIADMRSHHVSGQGATPS